MNERINTELNGTAIIILTALQVFFAATGVTIFKKYWFIEIPAFPNYYFETLCSTGLAVAGAFMNLLYVFFRRREIPADYNGLIIFISAGTMIIATVSTFVVVLLKLEGRWPF